MNTNSVEFSAKKNFFDEKKFDADEEEYVVIREWIYLSTLVKNRKAIGFPIVVYKCQDNIKMLTDNKKIERIYFEKFNIEHTNDLYRKIFTNFEQEIVFQRLYILYILFLEGFSSTYYDLIIIQVPKTNITFKIRDLYFTFSITRLVILSEKTILYNTRQKEDYILNSVEDISITNLKDTDSFIKCFFYTFQTSLDIMMYTNISKYAPFLQNELENKQIFSGDIVVYKRELNNRTEYLLAIVLEIDSNHCELALILNALPNNKHGGKQINFIIKIVGISEIYKKPNFIISEIDYIIG